MGLTILGGLAWEAFDALSLEKGYEILIAYVKYAEKCIEEEEIPPMFLEWYLEEGSFEVKNAEEVKGE